jgi:putative transposase
VFIEMERGRFGVEPICRTLGVSASAYYQRASGERSAREVEDDRLLELIGELHRRNYFAYGSWRMWKALLRAGEQVGRGRVERLMRSNGIVGAKRHGKPWRTTYPNAAAYRPPDRVQRDFTASRPDELLVADFTYLRCWEGVVYFAFVIDAYSRAIVGWQFAAHMRTDLVLDALRMALTQRGPGADVALVHHSDAGSSTQPSATPTVSTSSAPHPRSARAVVPTTVMAEAWVATFKSELVDGRRFPSYEHVEHETLHWIGFYNSERLHEELGDLPPAEYEELNITTDNSQTLAAR